MSVPHREDDREEACGSLRRLSEPAGEEGKRRGEIRYAPQKGIPKRRLFDVALETDGRGVPPRGEGLPLAAFRNSGPEPLEPYIRFFVEP